MKVNVLDDDDAEGHEGVMEVKWLVTTDCYVATTTMMATTTTTRKLVCWIVAMRKDHGGHAIEVMAVQG